MPVKKTRVRQTHKRRASRRTKKHMQRQRQRGGADDCNAIGKLRIPGYADCKFYYKPVVRATLSEIDPFYANDIQNRVLAAVHQWRDYKINKESKDPNEIDNKIRQHFAQGWPEELKEAIDYYLEVMETENYDAIGHLMDNIEEIKQTRPPYAPLLSPSPSPPPALSPVRSEEPVVRALNYSETVGTNQIPPAGATTKAELLAWIDPSGDNVEEPVLQESWAGMTEEELRRTVRTEEDRVYRAETIDGIVRTAVEAGVAPRDPLTRKPFTRKNLRALRNVMRETNPAYELPSRVQQRPPKHMGFSVTESANGEFYELSLIDVRTGAELADLGVIPAYVTAEDSGSTDVTSAVAIATLQRAWDSGAFLTSYKRPFGCCRFHLGKTPEYWTSPGGTPVSRLSAMITEIKSVLP